MTEVLLVCSKNGEFRCCEAKGHSGFAAKGKDIVCAAESCILGTALSFLEETESMIKSICLEIRKDTASRGKLAFGVEVKCSDGYSTAKNDLGRESLILSERLKSAADFIRIGISSIAHEYPEYVQLREINEA
ncbi:MAG: ribosomal-processing cysteine protease Prp [Spirochaetales bacterium]|nr:ribosomal-processing cysteine protease Prp [Spirochaetia bacterium]MDD7014792.1 ribosomal-processing cysteine protease Prp [Spirochaetales bacterium]